ncbi:hypothetical protein N7G274_000897 [Stereocaulon virgatum]|uniref:Uncharacterized protein n=1 Tax=Stereocaulon virgatum TaxID=373712 RepID=A0ABR4AQG0_9LECA
MNVFGFGFSFVAQALLRKYGFKATLLAFAAAMFAIPGATMFLLQEGSRDPLPPDRKLSATELPQPPVPEGRCLTERMYYRRPIFYVLSLPNLMQAFAFNLSFTYPPSFATDLGYTQMEGALLLAIANLAQIIGEVDFGKLSDKVRFQGHCALGSSLVAAIAILNIWGLSHTLIR